MAMLPIFLIGLIMGVVIDRVVFLYRKNTPSETQVHLKDAEIISLKADIESLRTTNDELNAELSQLKAAKKPKTTTKKTETKK